MDTYDIIHAAQNPAMNTYKPDDAKEAIRSSVDRAYKLAEVQLPVALEYEQLIDNITDKVLASYPYLTSQEVALVADSGVAGELGGRTKPSAAAFFGWLAAYVNSDTRKEAIRNYRRNNTYDPASRMKTPDEVAELNRQAEVRAIRSLWNEYKSLGRISSDHLDGYVAMACDGALKRGLFAVQDEHWKMARKQAEKERLRQLGPSWIGRALPYNPVFLVKWVLLEMCFRGQEQTGRDLVVNV